MISTTGANAQEIDTKEIVIKVTNLKKYFPIRQGILRRHVGDVKVVDDISFHIRQGETLAIVGERGCGKSTLGRTILQLHEATSGSVEFANQEISELKKGALRKVRQHLQMIFQDPYISLNPRMTVENIISEPLLIHGMGGNAQHRRERVDALLAYVGLNPYFATRYPHEFSGGQRQRISIARALATDPAFIVADEPTSALDISIHAQIVNLLDTLKSELGLTYLFIADDFSMVQAISDHVAVMYLGKFVEMGTQDEMYKRPLHPYTQALLSAIPLADPDKEAKRQQIVLEGDVPSFANPPTGCHFHPRCAYVTELCSRELPEFRNMGTKTEPHKVACHHAEQFQR